MPYAWEGNRKSVIAPAMRRRLQWFIHLRVHGLRNGDEQPALPRTLPTLLSLYGWWPGTVLAQWLERRSWPANFRCPALDLQLMGDHQCG